MTAETAGKAGALPQEPADDDKGDRSSGIMFKEPGVLTDRRGPGTYDRTKTPEQRWAEQRRRLLLGAAHVLARDGVGGASVAAVLQESGLSRGTFYRHFSDLSDAFHAVRREAALLLFKAIDREIEDKADPAERLRAGITAYLDLIGEHGDLARAFLSEPRTNGEPREELHRMVIDRFVGMIKTGLTQAVEQGRLPKMPDDVTIYAMVFAVEGVGLRYLKAGNEANAVEAAPRLVELCLKAFR